MREDDRLEPPFEHAEHGFFRGHPWMERQAYVPGDATGGSRHTGKAEQGVADGMPRERVVDLDHVLQEQRAARGVKERGLPQQRTTDHKVVELGRPCPGEDVTELPREREVAALQGDRSQRSRPELGVGKEQMPSPEPPEVPGSRADKVADGPEGGHGG